MREWLPDDHLDARTRRVSCSPSVYRPYPSTPFARAFARRDGRADRSGASAAQPARGRELVGHPSAAGLVADEAMAASVVGVCGFPLPGQGLAGHQGVRRAGGALADPLGVDQARLISIFDTTHDNLPASPLSLVVALADAGMQCVHGNRGESRRPARRRLASADGGRRGDGDGTQAIVATAAAEHGLPEDLRRWARNTWRSDLRALSRPW